MQTRRYPRTLEEAFGPYARELAPLVERSDPMPTADKIVTVFSAITLVGVIGALVLGVI
jgi:hypothetical protein